MNNKRLRKSLAILLIFSILFSPGPLMRLSTSRGDGLVEVRNWWSHRVLSVKSSDYFSKGVYTELKDDLRNNSLILALDIPREGNYEADLNMLSITPFLQEGFPAKKEVGAFYKEGKKNYYKPVRQQYRIKYNDEKDEGYIPIWFIARSDLSVIEEGDLRKQELLYREKKDMLEGLYGQIERQGIPKKTGDYHPSHLLFIKSALGELDLVLHRNQGNQNKYKYTSEQRLALIGIMDEVYEFVEKNRINEPEILDLKASGHTSLIDRENKLVKLYIPEGFKVIDKEVVIKAPSWVEIKSNLEGLTIGDESELILKPIDLAYNTFSEVKKYDQLESKWKLQLLKKEEADKLSINSIVYIDKYGERISGQVDEVDSKISMNIPFELDLEKENLYFYHSGLEAVQINKDGSQVRVLNNEIKNPLEVKELIIKDENETKKYDLNIEVKKSDSNSILDFAIKDGENRYIGHIENEKNEIEITLPFGKDLKKLKTDIKLDHRASIYPGPYEEIDFSKPVSYIVTSESGNVREYKVNIRKDKASSEKEILSLEIDGIEGKIEGDRISVKLPPKLDLKSIKPLIKISEKAKIQPASLETIDFSQGPVIYTVTAEDGSTKTYKVDVAHGGEGYPPPSEEYIEELKALRDNIYNRYKKETIHEDWEWMNIGFYEGKNNGLKEGIRKVPEDLPERFDMYREIEELTSVKLTDFARFAMMLTAMGIDASDITSFQEDGKLFRTDRGKPIGKHVDNFIEILYESGGGGINGDIFTLIAFDMGNYSIPANVPLTRVTLIDNLLKHKYGSDSFGIDMVAMLMQGLYPYQNHPVYGKEVRDKMEEGVAIFTGQKQAGNVAPLSKDYIGISWGDENSESTSQVIIALCAMGIDPFSDSRFSRGEKDNMIVNWVNRFATKDRDGFGHVNNSYNFMGTYQAMYALQWYINFIEAGGDGHPYSLYYDGVPFDFSEEFSQDVEMEYFELLGKEGLIDHENNLIEVKLPEDISDEDLKNLVPIIKIPKGSSISPKIGQACDFTSPVDYKITAEDGLVSKTYKVVLSKGSGIDSGQKDILGGSIEGIDNPIFKIDHQKQKVRVELPVETDKSKLKAIRIKFDHNGHSISPDDTSPQDFTKGPVVYVVSAKDGTSRLYEVEVVIKEADPFWLTRFVLRGVEGEIDKENRLINLTLPFGTYLDEVYINKAEFKPDNSTTSFRPGLGQSQDFNKNRTVSIVPFGMEEINYSLKIEYVASSGKAKIESFKVPGVESLIKGNTIELKLPKGMDKYDVEELIPEIKWSGKTIDPEPKSSSNSLKNYYKDYILTDELGNVNKYNIKFVNSDSETDGESGDKDGDKDKYEMKLESFKINGIEAEIDDLNGRIYIELPYELDLSNLSPIIKTSKGTRIYPVSGQALNLNRSARFTLTDGKKLKEYSLVISIAPPKPATKLWDYIDRYNKTEDYQIVY